MGKKPNEYYKDGKPVLKQCEKCGPGVYMAEHRDRFYCGKCHKVEYK
ncbi:MAG: 30S ribosomal protein S27ae [Candidatus Heimdallarchaeota archaeon]|nr:30S ribosomal protein S27ae [Candidatus Heimdallarchaeota archaeon]MCK5048243.1 30S ribosomal protein S27ae [Candidatus Heimdallarchaeota archaeon]